MVNLLNAVDFFGNQIPWDETRTAVWLIVIQVLLVLIAISLVVYLLLRRRIRQQVVENVVLSVAQPTPQGTEVIYVAGTETETERVLTGISLDLEVVQREFNAGDEFNCDGLVVRAEYSAKPSVETYVDYILLDNDTYVRLEKRDKTHGDVYVIKPYMNLAGKKVVTVKYEGQTAVYTVSVNEASNAVVEEQEEPVVQEASEPTPIVVEVPVDDKVRELLSISINTDNVKKEYFVGEAIDHEGLLVSAHFNVSPLDEEVEDYSVLPPDMSKPGKPTVTVTYQGKTVGYRITVKEAPEVVEEPAPVEEEPVVAEPQPEVVEQQQVIVEQQPTVVIQRADPVIIEEDSVSSRLRYDKSFTARLIQSEDEVKYWYTDLKNELLSFKSVHARISWKRETFKCHKDVIAKFAYRGKLLCIFLPLNPADYSEQYPVEDASDMSCYEDTPMMIRLKSNRRIKIVKQLIAEIMEKLGIVRVEHESVDYYMPYEGILELINKGLIKREIKSADDEKIFDQGKGGEESLSGEEEEDNTFALTEVAPGIFVTKKD